jgi:type IV secretion system protein VirB11
MSARIPIEGQSMTATSLNRRIQMLRTAMGPLIAAALEDPDVVEVMLNPDRTLWVDRLSSGRAPMGVELSEADGERIIRLVAAHVGAEVHRGQPLLSAELPETGERFEGILPPAAPGPAFALRKRAVGVIPLSRYIEDGMMTAEQAGFLVRAVRERQNILIAGATSSGKTTLVNALLAEIAATGDRVLVLEDTVELQCAARDHVPLRTRRGVVSMQELVRSSNLASLPFSVVSRLRSNLALTQRLIEQAKGLAYDVANLDKEFKRLYPEQYAATVSGNQMYLDAQERWKNTLNGLRTTMQMQAQASQNLSDDESVLADLVGKSQSAEGALQAMQAMNQLLALQAKQSIQTQRLQITQDRAASLELARQAAAAERGREVRRRFLGTGTPYTPQTVNFYGN